MKMQIWKLYVADGVMDITHGCSHAIYEAYVPELRLSVNHISSFVSDDDSRYRPKKGPNPNPPLRDIPQVPNPELIREVDLTTEQGVDMLALANPDNPVARIRNLIADVLTRSELDASDYMEKEDEDDSTRNMA